MAPEDLIMGIDQVQASVIIATSDREWRASAESPGELASRSCTWERSRMYRKHTLEPACGAGAGVTVAASVGLADSVGGVCCRVSAVGTSAQAAETPARTTAVIKRLMDLRCTSPSFAGQREKSELTRGASPQHSLQGALFCDPSHKNSGRFQRGNHCQLPCQPQGRT